MEAPATGSSFYDLETTEVHLSNDQTLADFVKSLLTSIGPNTFQAFSNLHKVLPAEGSIYIQDVKNTDVTDGTVTTTIQHSLINGRRDFINKDLAPVPAAYINSRMPCFKVCVFPVTPPPATAPARPLLSTDTSPALRCHGLLQHCTDSRGTTLTIDQVLAVIAQFPRAAPDLTGLSVDTRTRRYSTAASWYQAVRPGFDRRLLTAKTIAAQNLGSTLIN